MYYKPPPSNGPYIWQAKDWPRLVFAESALVQDFEIARKEQGKLLGSATAIGLNRMQDTTRELWVAEAVSTAAIEGERLDARSVRSSVARRLGLIDDDAPVDRNIDGLVDVMQDAVDGHEAPLDEDRLCRWQAALFPGGTSGIKRIAVGRYRDHADAMQIISGRIGREVVHYTAPPSAKVRTEMSRFLKWFEQSHPVGAGAAKRATKPAVNGIARAAIAHLWFETIHPFEDGNGRLGRAIIDLALTQDGAVDTAHATALSARLFGVSTQLLATRKAYYDALNGAQRGNTDVTAWVQWFTQTFAAACVRSQGVIAHAINKSAYWQNVAGHAVNERQKKVLARLLDAGDGGFLGGLTAEKYGKMAGVSKATATRDLAALVRSDLLVVDGIGKATRYAASVAGWKGLAQSDVPSAESLDTSVGEQD